jgi:predicted metalloprotease
MGRRTRLVVGVAASFMLAVQVVVPLSPASAVTKKAAKAKTVRSAAARSTPAVKAKQYGPNKTKNTPFNAADGPYADFLRRVGADLDQFWAAEMPATYRQSYNGLTGFYPYTTDVLPPNCGRQRIPSYDVIAGNAFYCRETDYIAFDNEALFPDVYDQFGMTALGVILAHEFGHSIQARTGTVLSGALIETQADCFSGAWLRRVTTGQSPTVSIPLEDLDSILQAVLTFRDAPGTGASTPGAHGTGFDRVTGLQLGYDFGTARCAAFTTNPPLVVAKRFVGQELANQGNVPFADSIDIANQSTTSHFRTNFPEIGAGAVLTATDPTTVAAVPTTCPGGITIFADLLGICPGDASVPTSIVYSADRMSRVYDRFGDSAVGYVYAIGWATLLEMRQGRETPAQSLAGETRAICLAATWYRWFGDSSPEQLSAGDLDEGIIVALGLQGKTTSFDRVRALRAGFETGPTACA